MRVLREPVPMLPNLRRRFCSRRCTVLALWPCLPVPPDYQPRYSLHDGPELPVVIWPAVPEPVPDEVERRCVDCGAVLPAPNGRGRPRIRCEDCRTGEPVPDWQRPAFMPVGAETHDPWLREQLRVPGMPWEEPAERW